MNLVIISDKETLKNSQSVKIFSEVIAFSNKCLFCSPIKVLFILDQVYESNDLFRFERGCQALLIIFINWKTVHICKLNFF